MSATEVQFRLSEDDWMEFARQMRDYYGIRAYVQWKPAIVYALIPIAALCIPVALHVLLSHPPFTLPFPFWAPWVAGATAVFILLAFVIQAHFQQTASIRHWLRKGDTREALSEQSVRITCESLTHQSRSQTTELRWHAITDVAATPGFLVFNLRDGAYIVIPRAAFGNDDVADAYFESACEFRRNAPPAEEFCPKCDYDLRGSPVIGCPECGWNRASEES